MVSNDESRMSPLVRRLRRRIKARRGPGGCLGEQVNAEQALFAYAYAIGISPAGLIRQWSGQTERTAEPARKRTPPSLEDDDEVTPLDDGDEIDGDEHDDDERKRDEDDDDEEE